MVAAIVFSVLAFFGIAFFCFNECRKRFYNPIPKFENGDKRIGEIEIRKTRKITFYNNSKHIGEKA